MSRCFLCEEKFGPNDERAEMYDPNAGEEACIDLGEEAAAKLGIDVYADAELVHADCGLGAGWEVA